MYWTKHIYSISLQCKNRCYALQWHAVDCQAVGAVQSIDAEDV